jgi:hypothetical protein
MATDRSNLSGEYLEALSSLLARSCLAATTFEVLYLDWYALKAAGSRCASDPASSFTFADFVEQVIASRISGTPLHLNEW